MAVFAANITETTGDLIAELLAKPEFLKFAQQNRLHLQDKTILVRLALINLSKNLPSNEEVSSYKAALLKPEEFEDFLRTEISK